MGSQQTKYKRFNKTHVYVSLTSNPNNLIKQTIHVNDPGDYNFRATIGNYFYKVVFAFWS